MDEEFWLKVYLDWTIEELENEIGACHRYQQSLLGRVWEHKLQCEQGIRLMITSQSREYVIRLAIKEKTKNGNEKND